LGAHGCQKLAGLVGRVLGCLDHGVFKVESVG
jgi:hypothetical protein